MYRLFTNPRFYSKTESWFTKSKEIFESQSECLSNSHFVFELQTYNVQLKDRSECLKKMLVFGINYFAVNYIRLFMNNMTTIVKFWDVGLAKLEIIIQFVIAFTELCFNRCFMEVFKWIF